MTRGWAAGRLGGGYAGYRLTNNGTVTMPVFDSSVVTGGTFVNRGSLTISSGSLTVATGVTLNHSGVINGNNTLSALQVDGKLTHDVRYTQGISLTVTGNATVGSSGSIDVTGAGLPPPGV